MGKRVNQDDQSFLHRGPSEAPSVSVPSPLAVQWRWIRSRDSYPPLACAARCTTRSSLYRRRCWTVRSPGCCGHSCRTLLVLKLQTLSVPASPPAPLCVPPACCRSAAQRAAGAAGLSGAGALSALCGLCRLQLLFLPARTPGAAGGCGCGGAGGQERYPGGLRR